MMSRIKFAIPEGAKYLCTVKVPVLISHINYGNHLGNDSLVSILHEARLRFMKSHGMCNEINIDGDTSLVITSLAITYYHEAFYGDDLEVAIFVSDITKKYCNLSYQVNYKSKDKNYIVATAITCLFFINSTNKKSVSIPRSFLNAISGDGGEFCGKVLGSSDNSLGV